MASASINPGVSDLLQTLSNVGSPVLSSPAVVSALEKASPSDIVQLSTEATQLEGVDAMFGIADGSDSSGSGVSSLLTSLENQAASPASSAAEASTYQAATQSDEAQALLGSGGSSIGSLFDLTG
jgi:hypothetical protein